MALGCLGFAMVVLLLLGMKGAGATTWRVGDAKGWQLNVNYSQWQQDKVFEVGDVLWFSYNKTKDNVLQVSQTDYDTCTTAAPIAAYSNGNTSVPLLNLTTYFFISGVPGHCLDGMTLQIQMGAQSPPPARSPAPSPSPSLSPVPTPSLPLSGSPLQMSIPSPSTPSSASPCFSMLAGTLLASIASAYIHFVYFC